MYEANIRAAVLDLYDALCAADLPGHSHRPADCRRPVFTRPRALMAAIALATGAAALFATIGRDPETTQ